MRFIIKGDEVLRRSKLENAHQLAMRVQVSHPTINRYVNHPEDVKQVDMSVIASILVKGLGLTPEQVLGMRIGELFDLVEDERGD